MGGSLANFASALRDGVCLGVKGKTGELIIETADDVWKEAQAAGIARARIAVSDSGGAEL